MKINDATLYAGDNGAILCGAHLGMSARYSGRDISGQPIEPVTPEAAAIMNRELEPYGLRVACETCGREPSLLHTAGV